MGWGEKAFSFYERATPPDLFRPSFQPWAYLVILAAICEQIDCLYATFDLDFLKLRLIFALINGPNVIYDFL
jgi:hypothetical protein